MECVHLEIITQLLCIIYAVSRNGALFLAYEILRKVRTRIKTNLTPSIHQILVINEKNNF